MRLALLIAALGTVLLGILMGGSGLALLLVAAHRLGRSGPGRSLGAPASSFIKEWRLLLHEARLMAPDDPAAKIGSFLVVMGVGLILVGLAIGAAAAAVAVMRL